MMAGSHAHTRTHEYMLSHMYTHTHTPVILIFRGLRQDERLLSKTLSQVITNKNNINGV